VQLPCQCGGEIEPEAVDVHVQDPVPKRVHDQLERVGVADVEAVAAAGVVEVDGRVAVIEAVVGGVVDAAEGQRRAERAALGGVVIDDIQDHLDAGRVQRLDHGLELGDVAVRLGRA